MTLAANVSVIVAVFLALIVGHWFPWHIFPALVDSDKKLKVVARHIYGVGCIIAGFVALSIINSFPPQTVEALLLVSVAAGSGTIAPRIIWFVLDKTADGK